MLRPTFSIVTPVYNTPLDLLQEMIDSVRAQTYADWELILVDDRSPDERVRELLRRAASADDRIVVVERSENGHIVKASNDGLGVARGEFLALLDHDDLLTTDALAENARLIASDPAIDVLYSDEDRLLPDGSHCYHFAKPDWSPWRLRSQNYLGHLTVIRTSLMREVGGFHEGFDGSQDHDLVLRVTERARRVVHIPKVLYHWRVIPGSVAHRMDAKPYATRAARRAVAAHLDRTGLDGEVHTVRPGLYEVRVDVPDEAVELVLIAGQGPGQATNARQVINKALFYSRRHLAGITVVHGPDFDTREFERLFERDRLKLPAGLRYAAHEQQPSVAAVLDAMAAGRGTFAVALDSECVPMDLNWLPALLTPLAGEEVALVGGLVVSMRRGVADAGLVERKGRLRHVLRGCPPKDDGPFGALRMTREADAIDGAAVAVRRADLPRLRAAIPPAARDLGLALSHAARAEGRSVIWNGNSRYRSADYLDVELGDVTLPPVERRFGVSTLIEDGWIPVMDRRIRTRAPRLIDRWERFAFSRPEAKQFKRKWL